MKKSIAILSFVALVVVAYSCRKTSSSTPNKTAYLDLPATPYNYFDSFFVSANKIATLGRVLFYDAHLSVNNTVSCGSCHKQSLAFADNVPFSVGYQGAVTKRNTPTVIDVRLKESFFWDGRETSISNLALRPVSNHVEMGIDDPNTLPQKLAALPYYAALFNDAYGDGQITTDRISNAIGQFMSAISSGQSRLDMYQAGNTSALTAQEIQGKFLFDTKYNCGSCHLGGGSFMTNGYSGGGGAVFLDIGLDNSYVDIGRGTITGMTTDKGTFNVPNLTNVALTAPYMHDGRYKTLNDVLDHYSHGIIKTPNLDPRLTDSTGHARQMNIIDNDKQAIIAFLNTLTDFHVITDPKFSNPFKSN